MSEKLAEEVANGLKQSREFDLSNLVTKDYIDMKLKAELVSLEKRLIIWQIGIAFIACSFITSIFITVLKFYLGK